MITSLLLSYLISVTHAPGWSDPVISIETPDIDYHRKDLVVTNGNHVHQVWGDFEDETRIGYNIILPDGTVLLPDTMLSRDVWSAYPSASYSPDSGFIGFWRENSPSWYTVKDEDGTTLIPPTLYTSEGWFMWPLIDSSPDSLSRVHMVWTISDGSVCYSVLDPGVGEVFRDTIPNSMKSCLVLVDGPRVHIKFNGLDQLADYIQYDMDGNVVVPTVSLVENCGNNSDGSSISTDSDGNAMILVKNTPLSGDSYEICLYKVDRDTGQLLVDCKVVYETADWGVSIQNPIILPEPTGSFYVLWREEDPESSPETYRFIKFAIIDQDGDLVENPYNAYDYSDEPIQDIQRLAATVNDSGDVFVHWSAFFPAEDMYYIVLGWFDHEWLGIEDETTQIEQPEITMNLSSNPFTDFLSISVTCSPQVQELLVYDITGRQVISLGSSDGKNFFWDGSDCEGNQLPSGAYIIRADTPEARATIKVVKLD
jgi:hypothetical protein